MERNKEWPKHEGIYSKCMELAEKERSLYSKTCWIHLTAAVEKGTVTPLEAWDAINLGYLPEILKVRQSQYSHLL
jgi:hypothetical protein